jgi:hypothetical protein
VLSAEFRFQYSDIFVACKLVFMSLRMGGILNSQEAIDILLLYHQFQTIIEP